ncbi:zinc-dependent metalloprotease [Vibrio sinaloensis]|uniref:ATPase n=1 Tax=Photobacterium sp. (strain ATCC 43367) TaxID=379097 RepID=A0A0A5HX78_PHOS4|nr:zinc-dependent metalloprotease [Vibrio sinaloensis]KGY08084.1 ATPase [Vibrio sinaloensis]
MALKRLALASAITGILAGCGADDQPYDTLSKPDNLVSKAQIKTDQVYLYMPSMAKAPKYAVSMAPFMQGQEKLVTLSFEGNLSSDASGTLQVRMISDDVISQGEIDEGALGRWMEDQRSARPVLSIPVEYVDYQCRENDYDECTNKEEKVDNNEVPWNERRFVLPDFAGVDVQEATWDALFTHASGCYTKVGSSTVAADGGWKGYEVTADGVINFEVETTYKVANNWRCMIYGLNQSDFDMSKLSFTVSQFYSLVPLDLVRSKTYEPIIYMKGDEDRFGFFASEQGRPDQSYVDGQYDQKFNYMHRFNPDLESIEYHLSDSFDLNEETRFFKQVTKDVVDRINPQLVKVGVPPIKLLEPSGKQSGDLRYNVINLIDEPLDNGLAGYGPSAANPITGEIVHAHVNQYSGVLRSISDWLWDRIAKDYNNGRVIEIEGLTASDSTSSEAASSADSTLVKVTETNTEFDGSNAYQVENEYFDEQKLSSQPADYESFEAVIKAYNEELSLGDDISVEAIAALQKLETRLWGENNMYPVTALRGGTTLKSLPTEIGGMKFDYNSPDLWNEGKVGEVGKLKEWNELSEHQQAELSLFIVGVFYAKTLVHEIGHNLGLRHNFKGSNDQKNYFQESELAEHGLRTVPGYSSIMDYNPSMLNALPVFGPYDLATLRFGYKREVEGTISKAGGATEEVAEVSEAFDINGDFIKLDKYDEILRKEVLDPYTNPSDLVYDGTIQALSQDANYKAELRKFAYCTDGNVSLNEDCNRHDEGRNRGEIMDYKLESYDDLYYKRTIRGMSANFTESTMASYANRRIREFSDWRNSIHDFERWKEFLSPTFQADTQRFYTSKTDPYCANEANKSELAYELYCGSPLALDAARDKLVEILVTPDHTCEVKDADGAYSYLRLANIIDEYSYRNNFAINHVPESCYDKGVVASLTEEGLTVTGEAGKYLNSGSAPRPAPVNNYSNYIDYVGHWGDKLAAAATLVDRVGQRQTTSRSTVALMDLVDLDFRADSVYVVTPRISLLNTIILGTESLSVPFKDNAGNSFAPRGEFRGVTWEDELELMPYYGSYSVRNYYKLPRFQKVPVNKAILTAMVQHSAGKMVDQRDEVFARSITIRSEQPSSVDFRTFKRSNGQVYFATAENTYAWRMIGLIDDMDKMQAAETAGTDLTTVDVSAFTLEEYQNADSKAELMKAYNYQMKSLENLPVYNTVRYLSSDLLSH